MIKVNEHIRYFTGIVEDRMDPMKLGRVRVRVFGYHPFQRIQGPISGLSTEDLQWMDVLQPSNSASMSGIGYTPTGPVEGSKVYGHWLDKYNTTGLVLGTLAGINTVKPNKLEGFSDPTGQYPRRLGSDVNPLTEGGTEGYEYQANTVQDSNLDTGINPDDRDFSDIPEDPNPNYSINLMIRRDEGLALKIYWDVRGYTVGIGHFIGEFARGDMAGANKALSKQIGREVTGNPGNIYIEEADKLFEQDLAKVQKDIKSNSSTGPVYNKVNRSRQMALENMAFQMGVGGLAKFGNMLNAMFIGDWETAYKEAKDSTWANQTPGRASRVSMIIRVGNLESYGIPVPTTPFASRMMMRAQTREADPSDPWTPTDSRILFKEPESSYKGEYPYVHTYESESGHIQEFDDTPGYERYRIVHPSRSYMEIAPDGRRTTKTVADEYSMVQGHRNEYTGGKLAINIGGDETTYNMSNRRQQIDGNQDVYVRGNDTLNIDGDGTVYVKGNIKIIVEGNAEITVQGNCETEVQGNYDMKVGGNMTVTVAGQMAQSVTGSWTQTMQSMSSIASGQYTIDGSRIDIG
ncbi:baseplate hub subunit and tail lysozyme [Yersinia phage vB_YenM_TG1]|uniref:Baseplate central spike protein n=1 Tax=Yersinia phage vB_YenM_TG1 TaxID=1589265 RepID=A0A0B5A2S9_9CAUD|nr:baseplate hub subunit and tail lysozyme [Yersinia phage vB_YenM_TG1]AJD81960.1 baseplate hub subunit and tail lysozyme [Yersinia phage vB_YenM_TG1]